MSPKCPLKSYILLVILFFCGPHFQLLHYIQSSWLNNLQSGEQSWSYWHFLSFPHLHWSSSSSLQLNKHLQRFSALYCSTQCTYSYTDHFDCTLYSQQGSEGIPSRWRSNLLDSVRCRSGPAASTSPHSSDSGRNFPGRMHNSRHTAGIRHLEESLWWRRQREEKMIDSIMIMCK